MGEDFDEPDWSDPLPEVAEVALVLPQRSGNVTPEGGKTGLAAVPFLGPVFGRTRQVFDGLQPRDDDSLGVTVGKRSLQGAVVVAAAGAAAICVF
jgi:hypothetical protein